jgi:hypothetical protein
MLIADPAATLTWDQRLRGRRERTGHLTTRLWAGRFGSYQMGSRLSDPGMEPVNRRWVLGGSGVKVVGVWTPNTGPDGDHRGAVEQQIGIMIEALLCRGMSACDPATHRAWTAGRARGSDLAVLHPCGARWCHQ